MLSNTKYPLCGMAALDCMSSLANNWAYAVHMSNISVCGGLVYVLTSLCSNISIFRKVYMNVSVRIKVKLGLGMGDYYVTCV